MECFLADDFFDADPFEEQRERDFATERFLQRMNGLSPVTTLLSAPEGGPLKAMAFAIKEWNPFFKFEYSLSKIKGKGVFELTFDDKNELDLLQRARFTMLCYRLDEGFLKIVDYSTIQPERRKFIFPKERSCPEEALRWYLNLKESLHEILGGMIRGLTTVPPWRVLKVDVYEELNINAY